VTTLAGNPSSSSGSVDGTGGPNGTARFGSPLGVAVDGSGNVYVADEGCACIRKIDAHANVTTLAGNGTDGSAGGTLGPTGTAEFGGPDAVAVDGKGNVYVSDIGEGCIRMITP
jgi:sugar lactone lactonase YvrE